MGWGVTYETGIGYGQYCYRGERNVAIFWSHSLWTNIEAFREYKYWDTCVKEKKENPHVIIFMTTTIQTM